jgi:hypothetical protein
MATGKDPKKGAIAQQPAKLVDQERAMQNYR